MAGEDIDATLDGTIADTLDAAEAGRASASTTGRSFASLLAEGVDLAAAAPRIDRFRVLAKLGQGAMGVVLAAHDEQLDRKVALKFLLDADASATARARLDREARSLARLSHPNVVGIYELGEAEGVPYLAMELVEGRSLRRWLAGVDLTGEGEARRPNRLEILRVFAAVGRGLAAAHELGVVHRDFKPDNVLIGDDGRPRVLDFGLARLGGRRLSLDDELEARAGGEDAGADDGPLADAASMTKTGALMGTPAYMAPEQWAGEAADARSDQFAFCVALFEALYGVSPFAEGADTMMALMAAVREQPPAEIPSRERVPRPLHEAIVRGLAKAPEDRWPSLEPILDAIAGALAEVQPGIFEEQPPLAQRAMVPMFLAIPLIWLVLELLGLVEYTAFNWSIVSAVQVGFVASVVLGLRHKLAPMLNEPRVLAFPLVIVSFVLGHRIIAWIGGGSLELLFAYDFLAIAVLGAVMVQLVDRRMWLAPVGVGCLAVLALAVPSWAPRLWVGFSLCVPLALIVGLRGRRDPLRGGSLSRLGSASHRGRSREVSGARSASGG